jgi:hypothetical protein
VKHVAPGAIVLATVMACSVSSHEPAKTPATRNDQQIINRLTRDIWPAVSTLNGAAMQSSLGQFYAIVDPRTGDAQKVRETVEKLGQQGRYDPQTQTTHMNDGLTVAHAEIRAVRDNTATLDVCYTYTHSWYRNIENTQHAPGASQAIVELANVNNAWYLKDITDDHVVPSCVATQ